MGMLRKELSSRIRIRAAVILSLIEPRNHVFNRNGVRRERDSEFGARKDRNWARGLELVQNRKNWGMGGRIGIGVRKEGNKEREQRKRTLILSLIEPRLHVSNRNWGKDGRVSVRGSPWGQERRGIGSGWKFEQ